MKKTLLLLIGVLSLHVGFAQYWGPSSGEMAVMQANAVLMQMQMQNAAYNAASANGPWMQPMMPTYDPNGVQPQYNYNIATPPCNTDTPASRSSQEEPCDDYFDSWGDKECYMCHGSGVCQTCNGKGWYRSMFGDNIVCPNCSDGKCGTCHGTGSVYGKKY